MGVIKSILLTKLFACFFLLILKGVLFFLNLGMVLGLSIGVCLGSAFILMVFVLLIFYRKNRNGKEDNLSKSICGSKTSSSGPPTRYSYLYKFIYRKNRAVANASGWFYKFVS